MIQLKLRNTRINRKFLLVCPYDHVIDRVSGETLLPIMHVHEDKFYELIVFKRIKEVMKWLRMNRPLKEYEK